MNLHLARTTCLLCAECKHLRIQRSGACLSGADGMRSGSGSPVLLRTKYITQVQTPLVTAVTGDIVFSALPYIRTNLMNALSGFLQI